VAAGGTVVPEDSVLNDETTVFNCEVDVADEAKFGRPENGESLLYPREQEKQRNFQYLTRTSDLYPGTWWKAQSGGRGR
jgi:hypothetical protein